MLLHHWFERHARERPDHAALVCDAQRYTFAQIDRMARALAITLQGAGLQRGDRVAIYLENCVEAVVSIFAVLKAGGVFMPVNPQVKADKLAYLLVDSEAHTLIAHGTFTETVTKALDGVSTLRTLIMTQPPVANIDTRPVMPFDAAIANANTDLIQPATIDQDLASIIYTSGSTGDAKGVMVTHLNMVTAATSISTYLGLRDDDIILNVLPIAFDYGLYQVLMSSRVGAT